jgi:hypothetical protein
MFHVGDDGKFGKESNNFQWMDTDGNGKVMEGVANNYLKRMGLCGFYATIGCKNSSFAYFDIDKNKDGFLTLREIQNG